MKTILEQLRDVLAGTAGESAAEFIRDELSNADSSVSRFFDGGKAIAERPFAFSWPDIAAELVEIDGEAADEYADPADWGYPMGRADLETIATDGESLLAPGPASHAAARPKSRLERLRDRLAGRECAAEVGADAPGVVPSAEPGCDAPVVLPEPPTLGDPRSDTCSGGATTAGVSPSPLHPDSMEPRVEAAPLVDAVAGDPVAEPAPEQVVRCLTTLSDAELLKAFEATSEQDVANKVFMVIVERYNPLLYRFAHHRVAGDAMDAEELVQDVWVTLWKLLQEKTIDSQVNLRGFLFRLMQHKHLDAVRRKQRDKAVALDVLLTLHSEPVEDAIRAEQVQLLAEALNQLPAIDQQIFRLMYFDGLSSSDIAHRLGIASNVVRTRIYRARELLRKQMEERTKPKE